LRAAGARASAGGALSPGEVLACAAGATRLLRRRLEQSAPEVDGASVVATLLPPELLEGLMSAAPRFAAAASPAQVAAFPSCLARLSRASGARFSVLPRWSRAWAGAAEAAAPRMTARQARRALAACRALGLRLDARARGALARAAAGRQEAE
jgi:hypothetical protein